MLEISHIFKSFKNQVVLKDITCTLETGSITAILGSSGSGKSTLLRCLARLEKTDSGSFIFQGKNIAELAGCFTGMVFQGFHLFPHLTVLQNLIHAPLLLKKMSGDEAGKKAGKWLDVFNLAEKANEFPGRLSGGQKQRVAIARTMMMEPSILLFDEPTSALDPEMVNEVAVLIKGLKSPGRLIIMSTHELRLAKLAADRILFIDQGALVEDAPKDKFFQKPEAPRAQLFLKNLLAF